MNFARNFMKNEKFSKPLLGTVVGNHQSPLPWHTGALLWGGRDKCLASLFHGTEIPQGPSTPRHTRTQKKGKQNSGERKNPVTRSPQVLEKKMLPCICVLLSTHRACKKKSDAWKISLIFFTNFGKFSGKNHCVFTSNATHYKITLNTGIYFSRIKGGFFQHSPVLYLLWVIFRSATRKTQPQKNMFMGRHVRGAGIVKYVH